MRLPGATAMLRICRPAPYRAARALWIPRSSIGPCAWMYATRPCARKKVLLSSLSIFARTAAACCSVWSRRSVRSAWRCSAIRYAATPASAAPAAAATAICSKARTPILLMRPVYKQTPPAEPSRDQFPMHGYDAPKRGACTLSPAGSARPGCAARSGARSPRPRLRGRARIPSRRRRACDRRGNWARRR